MTWYARRYRAYWDLVLLPLSTLVPGQKSRVLSNGETYGYMEFDSLPPETLKQIPYLVPEISNERKKTKLYVFGIFNEDSLLPVKSKDPFISYGVLPDSPGRMAVGFALKAYLIELLGWIVLMLGIFSNIIFIFMILLQLRQVY